MTTSSTSSKTPGCCPFHFAESLRARKGFRRAAAAFAFGFIGALAYPTTNLFPVLWLCFPALIFLLQGAPNLRAAFVTGWSFAFGYLTLGLYWIAAAMFVDIGTFWWGVPLAVAGLPAFFAIYYGIAMMLAWRIGLRGIGGTVTCALFWFLADYVRGHLFTGFPWNLEAYAWSGVLPVLQSTSVIGAYGLTLLTLVAACLPACLSEGKKSQCIAASAGILVFVAIGIWGTARLADTADAMRVVPDMRMRIVQPNTDQAHKWIVNEREAHFDRLLDLSSAPSDKPIKAIIWPETASTFYLEEDAIHRHAIATHIPSGSHLITGVIRRAMDENNQLHFFNSLVVVDSDANIVGFYDKFHLVPFGEYMPLRTYLPLPALVNLGVDFKSGIGAHTLHIDGLPSFSPFICYEAIFPGVLVDEKDRPQFLVNITNDGWYGKTAGPYQHFAIARVRAIEEGLPLVRAANTGISGVVDAYGRIKNRTEVGKPGFIDVDLPTALPPTLFSRVQEMPLWVLFGLLAAGRLIARFWPKNSLI